MAEILEEVVFRDRFHVFNDRFHAGELLANKLVEYEGRKGSYVLAIPAGGVEVGMVVAKRLKIPLDLVITRKIHIPWNQEAGFGAISWDGKIFLNEPLIASLRLSKKEIDQCIVRERKIIGKRLKLFRGGKPFPNLEDKVTIIVDDGLASGFSMLTSVQAIKQMKAKEIVVAVPTAPVSAIELIKPHANKIVCLNIRSGPIFAVADAYKAWYDLDDKNVMDLLQRAR